MVELKYPVKKTRLSMTRLIRKECNCESNMTAQEEKASYGTEMLSQEDTAFHDAAHMKRV